MANGTVLFIPPSSVNIIQAGQIIPGTVIRPSGILQYAGQHPENPNNQPLLTHQMGLRERLQKVETKTLGAIQIIIGLIHIGFGSVSTVVHRWHYIAFATFAGYPFWGGVFFIASGSLSIAAEKKQTIFLVKRSVGMNIASAIMSLIGVVLYITDLVINPLYYLSHEYAFERSIGLGMGILLLLFSALEFCITVWTAHFGCQATSSDSDMGMMGVPYSISTGGMVPDEPSRSPPPPYDYVVSTQEDGLPSFKNSTGDTRS